MGPEIMTVMALAGTAASAAGTVYGAQAQAKATESQAAADSQRAAYNQQLAERKAIEERANAQRQAGEELRTAQLAQSRLGAVAGASGSGTSDPTVMNLFEGIEKQGQTNASNVQAAGDQKAQGLTYQAALDRWSTDYNSSIKRRSASDTVLGGYLSAGGQVMSGLADISKTSMARRYSSPSSSSSYNISSTGYS